MGLVVARETRFRKRRTSREIRSDANYGSAIRRGAFHYEEFNFGQFENRNAEKRPTSARDNYLTRTEPSAEIHLHAICRIYVEFLRTIYTLFIIHIRDDRNGK